MGTRRSSSLKDATKALQAAFSSAKIPLSLPTDSRHMLQKFVEEHEYDISEEEPWSTHDELKDFWEQYVEDNPARYGPFVGVLRELRPLLTDEADLVEWWQLVLKPVVSGTGYRKTALEDAQEFLVACMVYDDDADDAEDHARAKTSNRLLGDLWSLYMARTCVLTDNDRFVAAENAQVAHQLENVLTAFGRNQPMEFFHTIDRLIAVASTRLQALTLLSMFIRYQTAHLYMVSTTPLIEHLLQCLMNDTSTTVLSVALASLIMLLPHIPGALGPHVPRLFLVYTRLLCWDKVSTRSAEADNYPATHHGPEAVRSNVGDDALWDTMTPLDGMADTVTPELTTYFTYLYGLYPLNFMSYVRKPVKYLKNCEYPGAEDFDLDQTAIRSRTERFTQLHTCHPNFFHLTVEEELVNPRWSKAEPADIVADCQSFCVNTKPALISPGPPPTSKLPEVPPLRSLASMSRSGQVSPSTSHASLRSGHSSRGTHQSSALSGLGGNGDSPILRPHDPHPHSQLDETAIPRPNSRANNVSRTPPSVEEYSLSSRVSALRISKENEDAPQTNIAYLQRENTLLRNELNFERWHKTQYTQHISQFARKNAKEATPEGDMGNLNNANQALKRQLELMRNARDATLADYALSRKQADKVEANLTGRFNAIKKEQETWRADAEELRKLRKEVEQHSRLLNAAQARELSKSHALDLVKRELEQLEDDSAELRNVQHRLNECQSRERDMEQIKHRHEMLLHEKETLLMRVERHQDDHEHTRRAYSEKVAELEALLEAGNSFDRQPGRQHASPDIQHMVQQAISDTQSKLAQLKKKHHALMLKHSDLELEYESVKEQLDAFQANGNTHKAQYHRNAASEGLNLVPYDRAVRAMDMMSGGLGHINDGVSFGTGSESTSGSERAYTITSSNDSLQHRRFQPPPIRSLPTSPLGSEGAMHSNAGHMTWRPPARQDSYASKTSSTAPATTYNQTAPLNQEETIGSGKSVFSVGSDESARRREKIKPDSQVRVYGRGGAQNIKLKPKEDEGEVKPKKAKGFRSLIR
ncbi:hypothetical protein LTR08_009212 [Meristemomyces frigidus]|nr:hypothetical protein LTR08_009212 [Meristemomyces frigidus]